METIRKLGTACMWECRYSDVRFALQEILDRTGYSLDVTTGQRKYGGPPPGMPATPPGPGHEVLTSVYITGTPAITIWA